MSDIQRIAFVSDVHGNLPALEAVLGELERRGPFDAIIGGGDYAFNGLYPAECVGKMQSLGWPCVRGNTDEWIVQAATDGKIPVQNCPPEMEHGPELAARDQWAVARLDGRMIDFLAGMPLDWDAEGPSGQSLKFVHATPWSAHPAVRANDDDEAKREMLDKGGADVLLYGHIHHAYLQEIDGRIIACIGATGVPFDGDPRPCFAIATDDGSGWSIEHVRVAYDNEAYARDLEASDMPGAAGAARAVRTASA